MKKIAGERYSNVYLEAIFVFVFALVLTLPIALLFGLVSKNYSNQTKPNQRTRTTTTTNKRPKKSLVKQKKRRQE